MTKEFTPPEGLIPFVEDPQEALKQQKERTIKEVFGYHLLNEIKERGSKQNKSQYTQERLPVYFHALSLGEAIVVKKIEEGKFEFDVLRGSAKKRYTIDDDGEIKWQIIAASTDPFAQLEFRKKLRQQDIQPQGTENLHTDHFLVNQMLLEGFQKHEEIFRRYERAIHEISATKRLYSSTLHYLPEQVELLATLARVQATLPDTKDRETQKAAFIKQYVLPDDTVISELEDLVHRCHDIWDLHTYLFRPKNQHEQSIREADRPEYENTLLVELITNPYLVANTQFIQSPTTTPGKIHKVGRFVKTQVFDDDPEKQKKNLAMVAYKVVEQNKAALEKISHEIGTDPALTQEYIYNLIITQLPRLPEMNFISKDGTAEKDFANAIGLNTSYFLSTPVRGTYQKEEQPLTATQLLFTPRFNLTRFKQLSPAEQSALLEKMLEKKHIEQDRYESYIKKVFDTLGIAYHPQSKGFKIDRSPQPGFKEFKAAELIQNVISSIQEGNIPLINVLKEQVITDSLPLYMRRRKMPTTSRIYEKKAMKLFFDLSKQKISEEVAYNSLLELIAAFILHHEHDQESAKLSREQLVRNLLQRENRVAEVVGREGFYIAPQDIFEEAERLTRDFYNSFFGEDFLEDPTIYLLKALRKGLENKKPKD